MLDNLMMPPAEHVLKVSALTRLIKSKLEENFARIWVQGEVSNLRKQSSGHIYFSLKDSRSQIPCVLFASDTARQSFDLEDGMEVLLLGDLSVYEPHGRYQMIAKVAIQSGAGRLQMEFERLKRKLAAEGLFDTQRKSSLPALPKKIAVITSPTGAAIQDFLRILRRRRYNGEVVIFPSKVQGKGAAEEIKAMLHIAEAGKDFDLLVLTRGGGSIEDLWAFNDESLARAVAACALPTLSAIGHEIDTVLTDFASDQRAETPSGAAELISSLYLEALAHQDSLQQKLKRLVDNRLEKSRSRFRELDTRMQIIAPARTVQHWGMRIDEIENRLSQCLLRRLETKREALRKSAQSINEMHPKTRIGVSKQNLENTSQRLERAVGLAQSSKQAEILALKNRLKNGSLQATLRRGYAVIQNTQGRIIDQAKLARNETELTARFHDGKVRLKATDKQSNTK